MTPAEFKKKWAKFSGKETSAYQSHFDDLCRMLGLPTPIEADPTGEEWFCFQKGVIKDAELVGLDLGEDGVRRPKKGFADVWKKDCFGWEYKGLHKNLDEAEAQLKRYREALLNPPLLVMCDFDRFIIKTNFNGTAPDTHAFTNAQMRHSRAALAIKCNHRAQSAQGQRKNFRTISRGVAMIGDATCDAWSSSERLA